MEIGCKQVKASEEKLAFISCFPRLGNLTFVIQNCFYTDEFNFKQRRIPWRKTKSPSAPERLEITLNHLMYSVLGFPAQKHFVVNNKDERVFTTPHYMD